MARVERTIGDYCEVSYTEGERFCLELTSNGNNVICHRIIEGKGYSAAMIKQQPFFNLMNNGE